MVRKPQPKDAAVRIRNYLQEAGVEITQRKALELVAIVEGHQSWQAMEAATPTAKFGLSQRKPEKPTDNGGSVSNYDTFWREISPAARAFMQRLRGQLQGECLDDYQISDVRQEEDDETFLSVWLEPKGGDGDNILVLVTLKLVENEQKRGQFALRLAVDHAPDQRELLSWTSGRNYSEDLWSTDAKDIIERLGWFSTEEVLTFIGDSYASNYFRSTRT